MKAIAQALEALTDDKDFETMCNVVLTAAGFKPDPRGGSGDSGRDAIEKHSSGTPLTVFQYSIEKNTKRKLERELKRYVEGIDPPKQYVFVTSRAVSAKAKDQFSAVFATLGIDLTIFDQEWLVSQLSQGHNSSVRDELLAKYYLGIPDAIRFMLKSPLAASALAVLKPELTGALLDEKLKVAGAFLDAGNWAEAKAEYDKVATVGGLSSGQERALLNNRANASVQLGHVDDAKADWRRAVELSATEQTPAANLGNTILFLDKDLDGAERIAREALCADPKNSKLMNVLGMIAMDRAKTSEAIARFEEALGIEARPEYLMNLWQAREDEGETLSDEDLEDALKRWPTEPALMLRKANRLIEEFQITGKNEIISTAREMLSGLIARSWPNLLTPTPKIDSIPPLDRELAGLAVNSYAGTLYWDKQIIRATELIRTALTLTDNVGVLFSLGQILAGAGSYSEAIPVYERAIAAGKDDCITHCQLGNAYIGLWRQAQRQDLLPAAAAEFERAAQENPEMLVNAATVWRQLGEKGRSLTMLEEAIRRCPESRVARVNQIIFTEDDHQQALDALTKLEQQYSSDFHVLAAIAEHYFILNDWPNALAYCRRVAAQSAPFAFLMEQIYWRGALCEQRIRKGQAGKITAIEFALEGSRRFPESKLLKDLLCQLAI